MVKAEEEEEEEAGEVVSHTKLFTSLTLSGSKDVDEEEEEDEEEMEDEWSLTHTAARNLREARTPQKSISWQQQHTAGDSPAPGV